MSDMTITVEARRDAQDIRVWLGNDSVTLTEEEAELMAAKLTMSVEFIRDIGASRELFVVREGT